MCAFNNFYELKEKQEKRKNNFINMSNDGSTFKPWKVRKGIFKSTGTSDYALPTRNTPSPIIEMPMSPPIIKTPTSPLSNPMSPRVTIIESPLSPSPATASASFQPIIHRTVREIPIERVDEAKVSELLVRKLFLKIHKKTTSGGDQFKNIKQTFKVAPYVLFFIIYAIFFLLILRKSYM